MEVFQEAKNALKQAMTKLENAPINATNIDRVLYKLNALKDDLKMLHYHITDIIVESKTPPLQYNVRITPPYEPLLSDVSPSRREPYPLATPCYPPPPSPAPTLQEMSRTIEKEAII